VVRDCAPAGVCPPGHLENRLLVGIHEPSSLSDPARGDLATRAPAAGLLRPISYLSYLARGSGLT